MKPLTTSVCAALALLAPALTGISQCDDGGTAPVILNAYAICASDTESVLWELNATVSDSEGDEDVAEVYADVYDTQGGDEVLEQWTLSYSGSSIWHLQIDEADSAVLDCNRAEDFLFEFTAVDGAGEIGTKDVAGSSANL